MIRDTGTRLRAAGIIMADARDTECQEFRMNLRAKAYGGYLTRWCGGGLVRAYDGKPRPKASKLASADGARGADDSFRAALSARGARDSRECPMFGLTQLGVVHTLISIIAVGAGIVALVRYGSISLRTGAGRIYVVTTALTCLTGFPIFQHGGFGPPHAVGVLELVLLAFAAGLEKRAFLGAASRAVETVTYTATFFLHMIPAINETTTRLPPSAPLAAGPQDPLVLGLVTVAFVAFVIGAAVQVVRLRAASRPAVARAR